MSRRASLTVLLAHVTVVAACAPRSTPSLSPSGMAESRYYDSAAQLDVGFEGMMTRLRNADVVLFGEQHDDPATHRAQLAVLAALGTGLRPVVLSLEMFERDVQGVLDDYLAGRIAEGDFLARARPWARYTTDYRALVELSRSRGWPVVAANVPRRLASAVSRAGIALLDTLSPADRALAALELSCPADAYFDRFAEQMKGHAMGGGSDSPAGSTVDSTVVRRMTGWFYESQCVKDETMAESIVAAHRRAGNRSIVLHLDGAFHSDYGLGTTERVRRRAPALRTVVLSAIPVADPVSADPRAYAARADFVIITRRPPPAAAAPDPR